MRHPQDSSAAVGIIAAKARADGGAQQDAAARPARRQRTHQATAAFRCAFDQEHHRAGIFPADRKALDHAQQGERNRCQKPERRVSRQQSDQKGRDRHGGNRQGQRGAPSEPVADMADQRASDRPHQIAERKHAERRKQLGYRILMREELAADRRREIAVDRKVVPLEHIADRAGGNDPERLSGFHLFPASCESARDCKL